MNASTITVHWHNDNQPIYSIDFQPGENHRFKRLATGGGDNNIRIWQLHHDHQFKPSIEYISTLRKHTQAVNVVRFSNQGDFLASGSDDGSLLIWKKSPIIIKEINDDGDDDDELQESWHVICQIRSSTAEINDICWSPDDKYIVTGSMDNSLRIHHLEIDKCDKLLAKLVTSSQEHSHYIQGVYWDPLNHYVVSQSVDRSIIIYSFIDNTLKIQTKLSKFNNQNLFYSETLQSFFRRLSFSPDGAFMLTPASLDSNEFPVVYVFTRNNLSNPAFKITGINKPAIAISFNPIRYRGNSQITNLLYKYFFSIATKDSVFLYSTDDLHPIAFVSNLHFSTITDVRWDHDGSKIIVSSADGFCSVIFIDPSLLGDKYIDSNLEQKNFLKNSEPNVEPKHFTLKNEPIVNNEPNEMKIEIKHQIQTIPEPIEPNSLKNRPESYSSSTNPPELKSDNSKKSTIDQFFTPKTKQKKRIQPTLISQ
jgi:chromatin assembly factor 1 subunit B